MAIEKTQDSMPMSQKVVRKDVASLVARNQDETTHAVFHQGVDFVIATTDSFVMTEDDPAAIANDLEPLVVGAIVDEMFGVNLDLETGFSE